MRIIKIQYCYYDYTIEDFFNGLYQRRFKMGRSLERGFKSLLESDH